MRVLINVPHLSGGGAEFVAAQWARYLASADDEVTVYTTHPRDEDRVWTPTGVSVIKPRRGSFVEQTRDLARYLTAHPADIVLSLGPYSNLSSLAAARLAGSARPKVIISQHAMSHGPLTSTRDTKRSIAKRVYRFADYFIAVSHPVAAEAIAEYKLIPNRVAVVPNPASAKTHLRTHSEEVVIRGDQNRLDLVLPGRLVAPKRPLMAVDIASAVSSAFPSGVTLHFFGLGPLHDSILARSRELGVDVIMHGWVESWFEECPRGSVVLLTSAVEGFGNVLVEAAAAGLWSVASSRSMGVADAIVPGITGELAAGDTVADYATAILQIPRDPVAGVEAWLQRFSPESSGKILRATLLRSLQT